MPIIYTKFGPIRVSTKKNPSRKKTQKPKTLNKKVGRWRVECRGRTVYAAGAKHSYKTPAAACTAYKRLTSIKSVEGFVSRYGKKKTKKVVVGVKKTKKAKKKTSRKGKQKNPRSHRSNAPLTRSERSSLKSILRKHGYV